MHHCMWFIHIYSKLANKLEKILAIDCLFPDSSEYEKEDSEASIKKKKEERKKRKKKAPRKKKCKSMGEYKLLQVQTVSFLVF